MGIATDSTRSEISVWGLLALLLIMAPFGLLIDMRKSKERQDHPPRPVLTEPVTRQSPSTRDDVCAHFVDLCPSAIERKADEIYGSNRDTPGPRRPGESDLDFVKRNYKNW